MKDSLLLIAIAVATVSSWFVLLPFLQSDSKMSPITPWVALLEWKFDLRDSQPHNSQ